MCPEPALLVAYLDKTLFYRDADAVDAHVETCESCSDLLAAMRRHREAEERASRAKTLRRTAIAIAAVALLAIGTWTALTRSGTPSLSSALALVPSRVEGPEPRETRPAPSVNVPKPVEQAPQLPVKAPPPVRASNTSTRPPSLASRAAARPAGEKLDASKANEANLNATAPAGDAGLTLRGRNANRRIVWRVRDRAIEHSIDGGETWVTEHTADRAVRAGAFVNADVAWLVGEHGLVLRRTKNGWFGATPPAEGAMTAVRASSPSKAVVTFDDGRVFTTENGGVTWSPQ
jgi:hypothetical protein